MSKKELRLTDTLEPEGGDFVRFLSDIERLQKKDLKGLEVQLPDSGSGMIVVSSRKEASQVLPDNNAWGHGGSGVSTTVSTNTTPVSVPKRSGLREPSGLASLFYFLATPMLIFGAAAAFFGINDRDFEFLIPVGMFCMFAGVVGISEAKKDLKRRQRARSGQ